MQNNGFSVVANYRRARYVMNTDVKCGKMRGMGHMDVCRTEVEFIDRVEKKVMYTDGPTTATPGLSINFDAIQFPDCTSL